MKKIGAFPSQDLFSCAVVGDSGEPSSHCKRAWWPHVLITLQFHNCWKKESRNPTHMHYIYSNIIIVYVVSRIVQCTGLAFSLQELQINRHRFYPITITHIWTLMLVITSSVPVIILHNEPLKISDRRTIVIIITDGISFPSPFRSGIEPLSILFLVQYPLSIFNSGFCYAICFHRRLLSDFSFFNPQKDASLLPFQNPIYKK